MTQLHGRRYEHTLVNSLEEITPPEVWLTSAGYSGNSKADACDIVIMLDPGLVTRHETMMYNVEAKKRQGESGKRISGAFTGSSSDETGVEELQRLIEGTPSWADPIVALKMDRRKLAVFNATWLLSRLDVRDDAYPSSVDDDVFDVLQPRLTKSESISIVKPETDEWPSATAAPSDAVVLAEKLGLPYDGGNEDD
jgi:hypothetical protein